MSEITPTQVANAARNDYQTEEGHSFTLGDRQFEIKDLDYDSYIEFCNLARPIIAAVSGALELSDGKNNNGEMGLSFNPATMDFDQLIGLAGKELPRMAHICCRQSDPKIKVDEVKRLARRPHFLLEAVLLQVKHNQLVKEFADFFPRIAAAMNDLVPTAQEAMTPTTIPDAETEKEV